MSIRLYQRRGSRVWYLRGTVRGIRIFETTGTVRRDVAEAIRAKREAQLLEESVFGKRAVVSFGRAALSYLDFEQRSTRTIADVQRLVSHFEPEALLSSIGQAEADRAVIALLKHDAAPATKRRAVYAPLTAILNHASARGWCDAPNFEQPSLPRGNTRWLTPTEAQRLIGVASPHIRPLLHFILCTGARMSEALDLDWADVDLPAYKVIFRDTKNGRDRVAMLPATAIASLTGLRSEECESEKTLKRGRVFRRDDGEPYHDAERQYGGQIKTAWRTACKRAALGEWTERKGKRTFVPNLRPHDLRHTWATWFYALTKDALLLKAEGGWQSVSMVERYAHLMPSSLVGDVSMLWGSSHPRIGALIGANSVQPHRTEAKSA